MQADSACPTLHYNIILAGSNAPVPLRPPVDQSDVKVWFHTHVCTPHSHAVREAAVRMPAPAPGCFVQSFESQYYA